MAEWRYFFESDGFSFIASLFGGLAGGFKALLMVVLQEDSGHRISGTR